MGSLDADEAHVPWGKYTYALEGLATGCYLEGACDIPHTNTLNAAHGQKLRFRVELPSRCFVLSVAVKLPNAPQPALVALDDIQIERTLTTGEYETVYTASNHTASTLNNSNPNQNPGAQQNPDAQQNLDAQQNSDKPTHGLTKIQSSDESRRGSPTSIDQTSLKPDDTINIAPRKKVMEIRRAADSLRLTLCDIDDNSKTSLQNHTGAASDNDSDNAEFRTLGVVVVGYVRGQTPAPNRIKILLNSSAKLGLDTPKADRAEVDGLLGLAFLGNHRYRQAAELLQRASELVVEIALEDAKSGCSPDEAYTWAAELNLLAAYAYFEHVPQSNDGIARLIHVANAANVKTPRSSGRRQRVSNDLASQYLDLRTELLIMLEDLLTMLVQFLGESRSLAVKLASARIIEFLCEQLGCTVSKHLHLILNQVLRLYPDCASFGARERAAASSFPYDSMEDCFERLLDICCRLFPLTEHSVLHRLYDNTLVPVFLDGFDESKYLCLDDAVEEEPDELISTAVAQTLRVLFLVLNVIGGDARVPPSLLTRMLNILIVDNGSPRTSMLLRRTALHTWDALSNALVRSARGTTVKVFASHIRALHDYLPKLLNDISRRPFEYGEIDDEGEGEVEIIKEEYVTPRQSHLSKGLSKRRERRTEIVDRHTLRRLLTVIHDICDALEATNEEEERYADVIFSLQETLARLIADVSLSSLIDVSYHEAIASGNGPGEANNVFEFGDINSQLTVVSDVLGQMFETYWTALKLLPQPVAEDAARNAPIRGTLGWCVDRMKHSAPPRGMLQILVLAIRGLKHELNTDMYSLPSVPEGPQKITFISVYRAYVQWFAQSTHVEAFDLMDSLAMCVANDFMAADLFQLVQGLGDQEEKFQSRTDASLEMLAGMIATSAPKRPDLAMSSLKALEDPSAGTQRIANGFPKSSRSNTGSFTRRVQFSNHSRSEPMSKSFYLHVVLASCFDRFDALARASKQKAGPTYMGEKIDAFVEHAALSVRCLHSCAQARNHRDYIAAVLGDIFSTCLAMQAHNDGRVRLAGFEIFAASLDVLFLAQKVKVLAPQRASVTGNEMALVKAGSGVAGPGLSSDTSASITELSPQLDTDTNALRSLLSGGSDSGSSLVRANSLPACLPAEKLDETPEQRNDLDEEHRDTHIERKMQTILQEGGSCSFQNEEMSASDLVHEEKGWQMLCAFIHSSLGIGKYVDVVVQRACLEYLKGCMLSALGGKSTGVSVISFEHIEILWESVNRLVSSPWRALSGLAMWVVCTVVNVAIYRSITVKGKSAIRQRSAQLHDFAFHRVFPKSESLLKHSSRETRVWGMRILEVYIKARNLNSGIMQNVPPPPPGVLRALENLKHDWDPVVGECCHRLLEASNSAANKKFGSQVTSFTAQAQNFMSMKRGEVDSADSSFIELWFPALPSQPCDLNMDLYNQTLEGFANGEIKGGEETELPIVEEEDDEPDDEIGEYDEDDEGFEEEDDEKEDLSDQAVLKVDVKSGVEESETPFENVDSSSEDNKPIIIQKQHRQADLESHEDDARDTVPQNAGNEEEVVRVTTPETINGNPLDHSLSESSGSGNSEDDDKVDDYEFAVPSTDKASSSTEDVAEPRAIRPSVGIASSPLASERLLDDDLEEEDEVVNVTDEDDVLVDVDSVASEKKVTRHSSGSFSSGNLKLRLIRGPSAEVKASGSGDGDGQSQWRSSTGPKPELNPDLEEGVFVLRRKGSFTSRPSKPMVSEAGETPKLARRRSLDVGALSSVIDATGDRRSSQGDGDVQFPSSMGPRAPNRRSLKSPITSPREAGRSNSGDLNDSAGDNMTRKGSSESASPGVARVPRRRSKGSDRSSDDSVSGREIESAAEQRSASTSEENSRNSGGVSPTGSGVSGASLTDKERNDSQSGPSQEIDAHSVRNSSAERNRAKSRSEGRIHPPKTMRKLPRAPAFLKGAGPQRKVPAPLPIGSAAIERKESPGDANSLSSNGQEKAASSNPVTDYGVVRSRMPRTKAHGERALPVSSSEGENVDKRGDRSHRFSRRDPVRLSDESLEEPGWEMFDDGMDMGLQAVDDLGNQMRVGTPTADASRGHRNLADEPSSSIHKKRGTRRSVTMSEHYKSLIDQRGSPANDEDQRESAATPQRDEDKGAST